METMGGTRKLFLFIFVAAGAVLGLSLIICAQGNDFGSVAQAKSKPKKKRTSWVTTSGLKKASWGSNVTITYPKGYVRYRSDGLPNHARQAEYAVPSGGGGGAAIPTAATATAAPDPTKAQSYDFKIPTTPRKVRQTTSTSLGTIGVMISGAALFNPYEADNTTVATASNFTVKDSSGKDVAFLDSCNGHPNPMGAYHYHALPSCVTAEVDRKNGKSHLIGIAFDGFPIYGDRDIHGKKVKASQLDKCNGITSATPEFPNGIYHYVLLNTKTSDSSIRCFHGTVDSSLLNTGMGGMTGPPGGPQTTTTASDARAVRSLFCHLA